MRLLGVCGSLRQDAHNARLLRAAAPLLEPGVTFIEFGALKAIPPFDEDDEDAPAGTVTAWREAVAEADGLLFATPEYNSSIPGQLKNAVDWASRPFATTVLRNKPVAVIGASTGMFGAVWAQAELRKSLSAAGARVIDRELPVGSAAEAFAPDGSLREHDLTVELGGILAELVDAVRRRRPPLAPAA